MNDGSFPLVWNNDLVDGSFGITSKIFLDQYAPAGVLVNSLEVPNSSQKGAPPKKDQMVTSFSSKSELALNLSLDGNYLTFMGYVSAIDNLDVSNSNAPVVVDPTNPVGVSYYRAVAQVDYHGKFRFTATNAYSGNNGRAAIQNNANETNFFYTAGNAGNGSAPAAGQCNCRSWRSDYGFPDQGTKCTAARAAYARRQLQRHATG